MHPDLMGATGLEFRFQQTELIEVFDKIENRERGGAFIIDDDPPFTTTGYILAQSQPHTLAFVRPFPQYQHAVTFLYRAIAQLGVHSSKCAAPFCQQQYA